MFSKIFIDYRWIVSIKTRGKSKLFDEQYYVRFFHWHLIQWFNKKNMI